MKVIYYTVIATFIMCATVKSVEPDPEAIKIATEFALAKEIHYESKVCCLLHPKLLRFLSNAAIYIVENNRNKANPEFLPVLFGFDSLKIMKCHTDSSLYEGLHFRSNSGFIQYRKQNLNLSIKILNVFSDGDTVVVVYKVSGRNMKYSNLINQEIDDTPATVSLKKFKSKWKVVSSTRNSYEMYIAQSQAQLLKSLRVIDRN